MSSLCRSLPHLRTQAIPTIQRVRPRCPSQRSQSQLFLYTPSSRTHRCFHSSPTSAAPSGVEYKVAAAFSGKKNVFDRSKHCYLFDAETGHGSYADAELAKRGRKIPSGQDSFFIGPVGDYASGAVAFGVADGVGGYQDSGIDSADFAHGLCRYMRESAADGEASGAGAIAKPLEVLQKGYDRLCEDPKIEGGGSTACVGIAASDGALDVANLGDSGFVHLRMNAVSFYSDPQTHAFNTPFQLSTVPPKILAQIKNFGGKVPFCDMPGDASVTSHKMQHGDVLVFATDGLWDNLTSQEVLEAASSMMVQSGAWTAPEGDGVQISKALPHLTAESIARESNGADTPLQTKLAADILKRAKDASVNTKRDGPFARAVQQAYPQERWHGGKIDDICVLVVVAVARAQTS